MDNDQKHEIDEENSTLYDVLLRLGKTLGWIPPGPLEEEVMNTTVQFTVQLAQVLSSVALCNAVLLPLIITFTRDHAPLTLSATQLLQWRLAVNMLRGDQVHEVG